MNLRSKILLSIFIYKYALLNRIKMFGIKKKKICIHICIGKKIDYIYTYIYTRIKNDKVKIPDIVYVPSFSLSHSH